MDDAAKAAKRAEIEAKVAAMKAEQKRLEVKRLELEAEGDSIAAELEQKRLEREAAFAQARQVIRDARAKFLARPSR